MQHATTAATPRTRESDAYYNPRIICIFSDANRASERKKQQEEREEVGMCMHLYAFTCICMLAAVLMVTVMQRQQQDKPPSPLVPTKSDDEEGEEDDEVSTPVCGGISCVCICMHLYACSNTDGDCDATTGAGQASEPLSPNEKRR